jgi:ketosteroid isomerase-like protein
MWLMTEDPVAIVRSAYEAFGRGDIPAVLAVMDPDVEWVESEAEAIPTRGTHIGPQAIAENVFGTVPRDWQEFAIVPEDFFAAGNTVIVRGRVRAVAKDSGRSMDVPYVHVFTIADGKLRRMTNHHDTAVWVETLGK